MVSNVYALTFQHNHDEPVKELCQQDGDPCCTGCALPPVTVPSHFAGSILKNQEDTFAAELHRLKQQPLFSLVDFEQVVDRIRSTVAEVCLIVCFLRKKVD